jgi:hypothetical protein
MRRKLHDNLRRVQDRIARATARSRYGSCPVQLIVVTKTVGIDVIRTLLEIGVSDFGENRVQELTRKAGMVSEVAKRRQLDPDSPPVATPRWHMIGHLQRNKAKAVLGSVSMIQSVDSLRVAEEIEKHAARLSRRVDILLEINGGDEPQKNGIAVAAATHLGEQINSLSHVSLRGLMSMAPFDADEARLRNIFVRVRELFEEMRDGCGVGQAFDTLSMGMSNDYEIAVECGATMVRIGSALFEGIQLVTSDT